jgi:tRNA threonylcarbamoyladenosine biosynthesis protein TsaE
MTLQIDSTGSEATEQFAHSLGTKLRGGEVLVLASDLGGGKTTFVRGLAAGMGSSDHVSSPTFTISREYNGKNLTLYHFDFYRLHEPGIVAAELTEFLHDPLAVVAIEWGDIVEEVLPAKRLTIHFERTGDTTRTFKIEYHEDLAYLLPQRSNI